MSIYKVVIDLTSDKIYDVGGAFSEMPTKYAEFYIDFQTAPSAGDTYVLTYAEKRAASYRAEADPLYFAYIASVEEGAPQADIDAAKQAWLDKRNEIKARYPKV